ncbi:Protein of unknown function (DUF2911) [Lacibacter cauensis]|jgi:hypothetical protein|uniref:DUF2911 family protein n=1 Tax=Lacibacter cauensis TaxID=510947 RepID=A0A562SA35_9BACT|nr:DUF2911 domain-containing protein [Lacibacter cauensis]TWI77684.1 Protein of unknown function (DUF2911) [Lacibacter cauensis]
MKKKIYLLLLIIATAFSVTAQAQKKEEICYNPNLVKDTAKKSIKSMAFAIVNGDSIKINYHSPGVRKRIIWGGLVPYDEVWVTGAHDATTLEMPKAFVVNGKEIPAGKYAIFTVPGKKEWILILNKNWKQHLATEYDEKDDIIRIKVKPKKVNHTERLQYFIETGNNNAGRIAVAWEKIRVGFDFKVLK